MDTTFYDRHGRPIAYTRDGKHIYTFDGSPVAYLRRESVYSYSGRHLGWFIDGWIRDNNGDCVFYTPDARGGPVKPIRQVRPVESVRHVKPVKSVRQVRPAKPVRSMSWSDRSGPQFFD